MEEMPMFTTITQALLLALGTALLVYRVKAVAGKYATSEQ
jgi:hypothetical protein